jgi:hypothetical protein
VLSVDQIRNGFPAACTPLPSGISRASLSEDREAALAPPEDSPDPSAGSAQAEAAALLDEVLIALLHLPAEGWFTVIDMLPAELVERLERGGWAIQRFARFPRSGSYRKTNYGGEPR